MAQFAYYFHKSPEVMGAEEIRQFQLHLLREQKLAVRTIALRMGALRFLYKKTLKRRVLDFDDLPLLKRPKKLLVLRPTCCTGPCCCCFTPRVCAGARRPT